MGKPWSDKEEKFLVKNYSKMRNEEIGKILNRSAGSIYERARQLGIKSISGDIIAANPKEKVGERFKTFRIPMYVLAFLTVTVLKRLRK